MKAVIVQVAGVSVDTNQHLVTISRYDDTDYVENNDIFFTFTGITGNVAYREAVIAAILADSVTYSWGLTEDDILWCASQKSSQAPASRSLVTGTGATGFQVSATKDAEVHYNVTIATTATIGGSADGTIVLEIAPTNSATAGDWVEVGRFRNGQAITLALVLQSVQTMSGQLSGFVPKGYYAKLRSITGAGSPTFSYNSGQEVLK